MTLSGHFVIQHVSLIAPRISEGRVRDTARRVFQRRNERRELADGRPNRVFRKHSRVLPKWSRVDDANCGGRMKRLGLPAAFMLACFGVALLSGCHGGGAAASSITIEIIPPATGTSVDVGATTPLNFTASLGDDTTNAGVTWKLSGTNCSGNGCGTLSNAQKLSVSYTPPPAPLPSSAALSVTLTATSVAQTSVTQTATISVDPLPTFITTGCTPAIPTGVNATCGLPGASNGQAYNQPIQITGGVAPYTFSVTSASVPLSGQCLGLTVTQTTNTATAIAGKPCNSAAETVNFTVQAADSGGAAPITQQFTMNIAQAPTLSILTTSLQPANLNTKYNQMVAVSGGVTPLTWSYTGSLPSGLVLNPANGQITGVPRPGTEAGQSNPTCAAPQNIAGNYCFSVTVTDSALPTAQHPSQAYTLTVRSPGILSISPASGTALTAGTTATGYSATIQASGGSQPYTWAVTQGQLPPGLALNVNQGGNAVISGVPTVVGTYSFTVHVTDAEIAPATQTKTATYSITIGAGSNNNSLLKGSYSFIFRGFDKDGWMAMIGTLTSDGNGNISGAEVINRVSGVVQSAGVGGTYSIDSNGTTNGASGDGRGVMQLTTVAGLQSVTAEYNLALESDGSVQFIQNHDYNLTSTTPPANPDTFATHGAGVMKPVLGGGFSASSFGGNYAFEFAGEDASKKPDALAGFVHADGASALTPGTADFNDAGTYHAAELLSGEFSFSGSIGAAELTLENPQVTLQFEYVFVSQSDLYFIETDANANQANAPTLYRLSGEMILQPPSTQFSSISLAPAMVATGSGVSGGNAIVSAGLFGPTAPAAAVACDGSTQNTFSWDQNGGGTISSLSLAATCTVNPNNGRVAFNWIQPPAPAPSVTPPFAAAYLAGPGQGFVIGGDATVATGLIELQTPAAFSNSSFSGAYGISAPFIAEKGVNNLSGVAVADGAGNLQGTVDEADALGASQTPNQPLTATISGIGANGRGTMTTTSPVPTGFPTNWIFYIVSPGQIRAIPADTASQHPQLIFFGPTP